MIRGKSKKLSPEEFRKNLERQLWCMLFAREAFEKALESAKLYLEKDISEKDPLHYTFVCAVATTYSKSFIGSDSMILLPQRFSRFDIPGPS